MTRPLVSVIIPTFNAHRWIEETITSVLGQTCDSLEIIVVDDGSLDTTVSIAKATLLERGRVVELAHSGIPGVARNRGMDEAHGDYVQFLDHDDILSPDKISGSITALESTGDSMCFAVSRWSRFWNSPRDAELDHSEPSFRDWDPLSLMVHMSTQHPGGMQPAGSWLVPRPLLERVGPWNTSYSSPNDDGEYLYRLLAVTPRMKFAAIGRLFYRSGINGFSGLRTPLTVDGLFRSYAAMAASLLNREDSSRTRYAAACLYQRFLYENYGQADRALIREADSMVHRLGGAEGYEPDGSRRFHMIRSAIGWKSARRIETMYRRLRSHKGSRVVPNDPSFRQLYKMSKLG